MKLTMIGTGYVGLVTGTCFAESGNEVTCLDIDAAKIASLQHGEIPIYEPGLSELIVRNVRAERLQFTIDYASAIPGADCIFLCVGTPTVESLDEVSEEADWGPQNPQVGAANLRYLRLAAEAMAEHLDPQTLVIIKSTVPVGTNRWLGELLSEATGRKVAVASNPEFLKEGAAVGDFTKPDRVVVGVEREQDGDLLHELYKPFLRTEHPFLRMNLESAEMTKYVANCMLATKISFINEMANLCELVGADINHVRRGIGHDARIGFAFLFPGVGYGGSCFPKDVRALVSVAKSKGLDPRILEAVDEVNVAQKNVLFSKLQREFAEDLSGRTIALWGLAFKPGTDDIREAPSLVLIEQLLEAGGKVRAHDPVAMENVRELFGDRIVYCEDPYDCLEGADALAIVTEWNEFRNPDFDVIRQKLARPLILDGRNLYDPAKMQALGIRYFGIGLHSAE